MSDQQEFLPEVVEALAEARCIRTFGPDLWHTTTPELRETWLRAVREDLRTLRGLGVLAGPHECVVPRELLESLCEDVEAFCERRFSNPPAPWQKHEYNLQMKSVIEARALLAAAPRAGTEDGQ